ncbi:MAG TPA: NADH-quinone oxidoreductase subunit C [Ignavibacteria bacterium]|nr:NADH-quinone oxidoreductase subunit C [Ignavibacteria bacterium]
MNEEKINLLKDKLKSFEIEYADATGTPQLVVKKENVVSVGEILKSDEDFKFDMLIDEFGVDKFTKNERFEVIVSLWSEKHKDRIFLKIKLDTKNPVMPTLTGVWKSANFNERETYDMFGIIFEGHPDMRRIYMPENFEYHPLRKDFPLMGIPSSLDLPKK